MFLQINFSKDYPNGDNMIQLKGISKTFITNDNGEIEAIRDISFEVPKGQIISVIGESGCGKSTLLKIIADLIQPTKGKVVINGNVNAKKIGFVFQNPALLPWRTVYQNIILPLEIRSNKKTSQEKAVIANNLIEMVGLFDFKDRLPYELSGGMQQRVSIARALSTKPSLLLMDEPFQALDEITRDRLNNELLLIWSELRTTILFVTHSIREAVYLSNQVVVLSKRPAVVKGIFKVNFPYPRDFDIKSSIEFLETIKKIRSLL